MTSLAIRAIVGSQMHGDAPWDMHVGGVSSWVHMIKHDCSDMNEWEVLCKGGSVSL